MSVANILDFEAIPLEDLAMAIGTYHLGDIEFRDGYKIFTNSGKRYLMVSTKTGVKFYFPGQAVNIIGKAELTTGVNRNAIVKYHPRLGISILGGTGGIISIGNDTPTRMLGDDPRLSVVTMYLSSRLDDSYEDQLERIAVAKFFKAGGAVTILSNTKDIDYNVEIIGSIVNELNVIGDTMFVVDHIKGLSRAPRPILCYNRIYYSNEEGLSRLL